MIKYQIEGYFSTRQCGKIKEKLQGKTYMNFNIECGGVAGNNEIVVTSNYDGTNEDLKEMFIHYVLNCL